MLLNHGKYSMNSSICIFATLPYKVLFSPTFKIIQMLQNAKEKLELEKALKKLDSFDIIIIDDIGYVQHSREEMEVFFTFLADRYERKCLMISSNLTFAKWDNIFKDPMTAMAAVDRLVHHFYYS